MSSWRRGLHNKNPALRVVAHHEGKADVSDTESSAWRRVSYEVMRDEGVELMLSPWMMMWDEDVLSGCMRLSISL